MGRPITSPAIREAGFEITFHGVRGSTPCHGEGVARYGGNTSCVSVSVPGNDPILLDLGTGSRYFGVEWASRPFRGTCLLSHMHWDHIQGLPFFPPLLRPGNRLTVHGPAPEDGSSLTDVVASMLCPPLFPVGLDAFPAEVVFEQRGDEEFTVGDVRVMSRLVPHIGNTLGFRLEWGGLALAYISDHQQPGVDIYETTDSVRELCDGADLLIHDAQYSRDDFEMKATWGHCTVDYALWVAAECGVKTLALYHHDPLHDDDTVDRLVAGADAHRCETGVSVIGAREGLTVPLRS
jgi:phosphoribosyl 1,2-cyclic phosphodiesterase